MQALKLTKPQDDPVYLFMLKKEQDGKPHNVAKMAGINKFLRIYYARAMALYKSITVILILFSFACNSGLVCHVKMRVSDLVCS